MRNKDDKKCKKGQETTIGKIIYGFLLFMPLFAIGVTCGYAMFNKNAYLSSESNEIQAIEPINNNDDIIFNTEYTLIFKDYTLNQTEYSPRFSYSAININWSNYFNGLDESLIKSIDIRYDVNNNNFIYLRNENGQYVYINGIPTILYNKWGTEIKEIIMTLTNVTDTNYYGKAKTELTKVILVPSTLSNVFYDSVDKVTESPLFSWAQNSIVYTTLNNTCNTLSITTPFIPLLMSYWLIISVIYFLYDIALMLIWLLHNKIHELQESF